jgi:hypothetical protein
MWRLDLNFHPMLECTKEHHINDFFMETFLIGAWLIWKQRNGLIFNRGKPSFLGWKLGFIKEVVLQSHRIREDKKSSFLSFLQLYR